MENIIKDLKEIGENFMFTTQAMAQFPTPVVDSTKIDVKTEPDKEEEFKKEKEIEQ